MRVSDIEQLFTPQSVAVFGASDSEGSIGGMVFRNLLDGGFKGTASRSIPSTRRWPANPAIATLRRARQARRPGADRHPAERFPAILNQCGGYGVKVAVVHSAGFGE